MDIARESAKKIRQLEYVVNQLQSRIAQIAGSYELEIAVLKSELEEVKRLADPEEED
jgi:hypothetical protein